MANNRSDPAKLPRPSVWRGGLHFAAHHLGWLRSCQTSAALRVAGRSGGLTGNRDKTAGKQGVFERKSVRQGWRTEANAASWQPRQRASAGASPVRPRVTATGSVAAAFCPAVRGRGCRCRWAAGAAGGWRAAGEGVPGGATGAAGRVGRTDGPRPRPGVLGSRWSPWWLARVGKTRADSGQAVPRRGAADVEGGWHAGLLAGWSGASLSNRCPPPATSAGWGCWARCRAVSVNRGRCPTAGTTAVPPMRFLNYAVDPSGRSPNHSPASSEWDIEVTPTDVAESRRWPTQRRPSSPSESGGAEIRRQPAST